MLKNLSGIFKYNILLTPIYQNILYRKIIGWFLDFCYFFNIIDLVYRSNEILY